MQQKPHSKIDMTKLRRRAKSLMRKKFKKKIKLSDIDKIWKDYVKYGIVKPLLYYGSVEVKTSKIEIIGRRSFDDKKTFSLTQKGLTFKGYVKPVTKINKNRMGVVYKIVFTDTENDKLVFKTAPYLRKKVAEQLMNTNQYYKII